MSAKYQATPTTTFGYSHGRLKRIVDAVAAFALLLGLVPLLLFCAIAILVDSPGPILFRQQRVGEGGKLFTLFKFRSMRSDADPDLHRAYVSTFIQGQASHNKEAGREIFKLTQDPRITRVGRWLRRTSLDELPQLWNVLKGEMSLVGPRPPIPYELEFYAPGQRARLQAKPGITGLWQVSGRNTTTFDDMVKIDLDYIRRASLRLDIEIMLKTIPVLVKRDGG